MRKLLITPSFILNHENGNNLIPALYVYIYGFKPIAIYMMPVCAGQRPVAPQLIFIVSVVDLCSTSRFYIYIVCVDRTGSLSGGAFNQLRLVTLNIVLTILY